MAAVGLEPEPVDNKEVTTNGQAALDAGQIVSNTGQAQEVTSNGPVNDRSSTGQGGPPTGQNFAPTWPQRKSDELPPDLAAVVSTWPNLPQVVKVEILALIRGSGERHNDSPTSSSAPRKGGDDQRQHRSR